MMTWIPRAVQIGPFTLPIDRLSIILGVLVGLYVLQKFLTRSGHQGIQVANVFFESLILGFFSAMLSPVVLNVQEVISHPMTTLFGGLTIDEYWIGGAVFVIALVWKFRAVHPLPPIPALLDALVGGCMIGLVLPSFAVEEYGVKGIGLLGAAETWYQPIFIYRALLLLIGFFIVFRMFQKTRTGICGAIGLVWIGWMQLLLSLVEADSPNLLNLTETQEMGLMLAVLGIVLHRRFRRALDQEEV